MDALEEEMSKVLITYDMKSQYDRAEGKTNLVTHSEALSQLKQLILKDVLEMVSEVDASYRGKYKAPDSIKVITDLRQSARKRYQS